MATDSKIEWTTHTFNPWRGCTKVSPGCAHCYADTLSKRNPKALGVWGPRGTRVVASGPYWRQPLKWDAAAKAAGERHRVFCASLADVFEGPETMPADSWPLVRVARAMLVGTIRSTPNLDWLLLTKRPENVLPLLRDLSAMHDEAGVRHDEDGPAGDVELIDAWVAGNAPANIWLGTSVENQKAADERIPHLLKCPAAVRFLSCEPLLGPLEFSNVSRRSDGVSVLGRPALSGIGWVIVGGESGPGARPFELGWAKDIVRQCQAAGVAAFVKQVGSNPTNREGERCPHIKDKKGGDMSEWPEELRVRTMPAESRQSPRRATGGQEL